MPIPEQFNGSLSTWWNQVVGDLSQANGENAVFEKYWSAFTPEQRVAIIGIARASLATATESISEIDAYLQTIPTA